MLNISYKKNQPKKKHSVKSLLDLKFDISIVKLNGFCILSDDEDLQQVYKMHIFHPIKNYDVSTL